MQVTAEEFKKNPRRVYRAADKEEIVIINHNHYPDKVFQLVATDAAVDAQDGSVSSWEEVAKAGDIMRASAIVYERGLKK